MSLAIWSPKIARTASEAFGKWKQMFYKMA